MSLHCENPATDLICIWVSLTSYSQLSRQCFQGCFVNKTLQQHVSKTETGFFSQTLTIAIDIRKIQ